MLLSDLSAISPIVQGLQSTLTKSSCTSDVFKSIKLDNADILSIRTNTSNAEPPPFPTNEWPTNSTESVSVCQVTIQHTHPGWNDTITTYVWLPVSGWNKRFVGVGGRGWSTGRITDLGQPASKGYAAVTTDGGHSLANLQELTWALTSPGNLNWPALQNFAAVSLDDATTLGKAVTTAYYGRKPEFSYWNGCSTGGRQGHMMAQRYPTQYDGILATSSGINWDKFIMADYWPQVVMNIIGYYPPFCELDAITQAAIEACDSLDGVKDGIISNPDLCNFNPKSVVGLAVDCINPSGTITISEEAAEITSAIWRGPRTEDGKFFWYGFDHSANLIGVANTTCTSLTNCTSTPFDITGGWLSTFILQNSSASFEGLTHAEYSKLFRQSVNRFASVLGTADADLTDFKNAGGKMISWHGTADEAVSFKGSMEYYKRVLQGDSRAADYYRFFVAPGVGHCHIGPAWYPGSGFDALVKWVEDGIAPDTLYAESIGTDKTRAIELCAYPKQVTYIGGDTSLASSFTCSDTSEVPFSLARLIRTEPPTKPDCVKNLDVWPNSIVGRKSIQTDVKRVCYCGKGLLGGLKRVVRLELNP